MKQAILHIWVDEAGRGPWAGPVVAAACVFLSETSRSRQCISQLRDSKKLTSKKRSEIFRELIWLSTHKNIAFGIWVVDNDYIDTFGIKKATREAMKRSLIEVLQKLPKDMKFTVVIDGNDHFVFPELKIIPNSIIRWDETVPEISAASIIAKVFRDQLMIQYDQLYPDYHFWDNKWYGTKWHSAILQNTKNITSIHRKSFAPVKKVLEERCEKNKKLKNTNFPK